MIRRRNPIQSAVAGRKLFANGGMVNPVEQQLSNVANQMAMQQQMAMRQQPQRQQPMGIMASSQPLVDAVTADANNPMGGNTLSMAQGGAVVDTSPAYMFANGGLNRTQTMTLPYATDRQMEAGQILADRQVKQDREKIFGKVINTEMGPIKIPGDLDQTRAELLEKYYPSPSQRDDSSESRLGKTARSLGQAAFEVGVGSGASLADYFLEKPLLSQERGEPLPKTTANMSIAETLLLMRAAERGPEFRKLTSEVLNDLYTDESKISFFQNATSEEIGGVVAAEVSDRLSGAGSIGGAAMEERGTNYAQMDPNELARRVSSGYLNASASGELDTMYGGDENSPTPELDTRNEFLTEAASEYGSEVADLSGALIASANAPAALSQGDVISDEALASGVAALDEEADTRIGMGTVGDGGAAALLEAEARAQAEARATADAMKSPAGAVVNPAGAVVDPAGSVVDRAGSVVDPAGETAGETAGGDTSAAMPAATATTDTGGGAAAAVAQVFDKPMTKDDATKSIQDYKEKFLAEMPEYEGMSEEEKGFAFIEAGLRVMAGQSPNAITNIAKGLQGLGPELAKGAKEKREWNRQIELSAAKYSLQNMARDAAEERADAREGYFFYDQSKKSDKLPYGQMVFLSKGKLADLGGNIPANLADKDLLSKTAATTAAAAANLKKVLRGELDDYKISSVEADRYVKQLDKAKVSLTQSEAGISLLALTKARIAASPGEIGSFASGFNELLRKTAVGVDLPWAKRFTTGKYTLISQARSDVNVALQALIKSSLGSTQAANSISNKDVELLANAYVDSAFQSDKSWDFLGIDENALGGRLDKAIQVFRDNQENALSTFDRITTRIDQAEDTFKQSKTLGLNTLPGPFERDYFSAQIQQIQPYADKLRNISNTTGSVQVSVPVLGANIQSPTGTYTLDKSGKYIFIPKVN